MQETWVQSLGQEDPLEKEIATHSSILAGCSPWGHKGVGHDLATKQQQNITKKARVTECLLMKSHSIFFRKQSNKNSGQASRFYYQFTGNTKDRGTC